MINRKPGQDILYEKRTLVQENLKKKAEKLNFGTHLY